MDYRPIYDWSTIVQLETVLLLVYKNMGLSEKRKFWDNGIFIVDI